MKVVYAPRALRDIDEILAYIRKRSPRGAHNVSLTIEHAIGMCALNPYAAAATDEPNVRRRPLGKYRYTIFYRTLAPGVPGDQGTLVIADVGRFWQTAQLTAS